MSNERQKIIAGYEHPDKTIKSRGTKYKTFTEGQKPKKKEKFGSTIAGSNYASYDISQENNKTHHQLEKERQTFEKMTNQQDGK